MKTQIFITRFSQPNWRQMMFGLYSELIDIYLRFLKFGLILVKLLQ